MQIDLLNKTIEAVENPGLETTDPRLGDIVTLVQNGAYTEAAERVQEIFAAGVYDIRLTGFFLYGVFLDEGLGALKDVFQTLTRLLLENWEAVGPSAKKERHAKTSINWLIKQVDKKLQYEEKRQGAVWNRWCEALSSEDVALIIENLEALQPAMMQVLDENAGPLLEMLLKINKWLSNFQQLVYQAPEAETESHADKEPSGQENEHTGMNASGAQSRPPSAESRADVLGTGASYPLQCLLKKMKAFERLVEAKHFLLAAMVADDINAIIADFDPRVFFPELFKKYSYLLAVNISRLTAFEDHKHTIEWQAMQDLYHVDLNDFMSLRERAIDPETFSPLASGAGGKESPTDEGDAALEGPDSIAGSEDEDDW